MEISFYLYGNRATLSVEPADLLKDLMQRAINKLRVKDLKAENCICICVYTVNKKELDINSEIKDLRTIDQYREPVSIYGEALYIVPGDRRNELINIRSPYK
jgi:hypothetical protein